MAIIREKSPSGDDLRKLLRDVGSGFISPDEAFERLVVPDDPPPAAPERDVPGVRLDFAREDRKGVGEVVYCPGKSDEQLLFIAESIRERGASMAFSRLSPEQAEMLSGRSGGMPPLVYNPISRLGTINRRDVKPLCTVVILSAGSSDIPIAEEAAGIAEFYGAAIKRFYDVGVSGLHRLLGILDELKDADVIIVAAGMDGALPSVVAGLVSCLVIGLPTSVGYGVAKDGRVALSSMLASCSPGLVVVNIDNGIGAGLAAFIVAKQHSGRRRETLS
ncbi:MAG: nickel pincer cofactor biosynthesis protein LarB [Synergistaceae bacterium]|jgi:NCAIR mutase (PurE)-related protein|nr:nickel pincer cofactor biosynthesis protein LarB [Synergistaceae bacterium]